MVLIPIFHSTTTKDYSRASYRSTALLKFRENQGRNDWTRVILIGKLDDLDR